MEQFEMMEEKAAQQQVWAGKRHRRPDSTKTYPDLGHGLRQPRYKQINRAKYSRFNLNDNCFRSSSSWALE